MREVLASSGRLQLSRRQGYFDLIFDGHFLMSSQNGLSEKLMGEEVAAHLKGEKAGAVLVGGLGFGLTLRSLLDGLPPEASVTVVEIEPAVVEWNRTHLSGLNREALSDPRVKVVVSDLVDYVKTPGPAFDAICLDIDNGPGWTVLPTNGWLYGREGLERLGQRLKPGGTLAVWSSDEVPAFGDSLSGLFAEVSCHEVIEPLTGQSAYIYSASIPALY